MGFYSVDFPGVNVLFGPAGTRILGDLIRFRSVVVATQCIPGFVPAVLYQQGHERGSRPQIGRLDNGKYIQGKSLSNQ